MTLGEKIKQARLEAGLSQRQLCGEEVTRNMLSQIENGAAKPSMKTLSYFAARLGKTVSYFLEEDTVLSPNQEVMTLARKAVGEKDFQAAAEILGDYRGPDGTFDGEFTLLHRITALELARAAIADGRKAHAADILEIAYPLRDEASRHFQVKRKPEEILHLRREDGQCDTAGESDHDRIRDELEDYTHL